MTFLKKLISPPVFDDETKTLEAKLLNFILWGLIISPIPYIVYIVTQEPKFATRTLVQIVFGEAVNIFLLWLMHRGKVRAASLLQVSLLWLFFTITAFTGEGVNGKAYLLGYPLIIFISGSLLGTRGALVAAGITLASGWAMVITQTQGWAKFTPIATPAGTWIISLAVFPMLALLQYLTRRELRSTLWRAHASEERYRLISEVTSDYTFSTEINSEGVMRLNWVAGAFENITGFTFDEYVASGGWLGHLHPDDVEKDAHDTATLKTNQPVVTEIRTFKKNGNLSWVRVYAHPVWDEKQNRLTGIVGAVKDITMRKQAEDALTHERDLLQIFMDNIPDHVYFKDTESQFVRINKAQANFLELNNPQDAIGKTDLDFQPFDLARQFIEEEQQILKSGQPIIDRIEFNPSEDGTPRWLAATKVPIRDASGRLTGTIGISRDITKQKLTEAMLAYERDILQIFMDNIPDQVYFKDTESRFVRINQGQARFLGVNDPQEAVGKTDLDFQNLELAREFLAEEKRIIETGKPVLSRIEFNPTRDGKPRWLLTNKVPAKNELGQIIGTIGISFDITEQKLAEQLDGKRREILEKVLALGKHVAEVNDLKTTLNRLWHAVIEDLGFDRFGIFLYNAEQNLMERALGTDRHGKINDTQGVSFPVSESSIFQRVLDKPDGLYLTNNFDIENNIPIGHEMYGVKSYAAVAVWAGNKPVGVISVDQLTTQRIITEQQLEALRLFAGYAGLAIENSRLKEAIQNELMEQKQAEEREQRGRVILEKIVKLGQYVTEVHDLRTTLQRIWHNIRNELNFDRVGIYLYDPVYNILAGTYGTNNLGEMVDEWDTRVSLDHQTIEAASFRKVLQEESGIYITHNYMSEHGISTGNIMDGVTDFAAVAARAGDKPVAVICVDNVLTKRPITDEQVDALRLFAGYAGLAIENSRLKDTIQNELTEQKRAEEFEQRRRVMLEKVMRLGKQVTEVNDLPTTLRNIWHGVRYDLDFDRVGLFLYNSQENTMEGAYGTDRDGKIWDAWHVRFELDDNALFYKVLSRPDGFFLTKDYEVELKIPPNHDMEGVKYWATVAVWAGDKPVAIISVDQLITGRTIPEDKLEALRLFAGYAGLAIENSRLKDAIQNELMEQKQAEELEQRRRLMLEKVIQLGKQVTVVSDFRTTLKNIWKGVRYDLGFDRVGLFLYNSQENTMDGTYGTDITGEIWDAWHVKIGLGDNPRIKDAIVFHKVLDRPDGFYFTKDYESEFDIPPDNPMAGVKYYAVAAVWSGNKPVAIISVDQLVTQRPFSDEQLEALRLFAGYAGLAISNAHLNDALEAELEQRQNLINELETKNAELERFTYTVSHDLKSPLVTITGFLGYLEKDALSGNKEKIKGSVNRISHAAEKMQELLNDLLELSRIGRLMNPPENIPFDEIVNEAMEHVQGRLNEQTVLVKVQKNLPIIRGDRARLVEVMQNLIDNAAKYSDPNRQSVIEIGATEDQNNNTVYFVRDNGIGVDPQFHERIFGLFNKLNPHSEGTGIGLSLIKRIIEVHNGQIWVESEAGKGATFYFTLPKE